MPYCTPHHPAPMVHVRRCPAFLLPLQACGLLSTPRPAAPPRRPPCHLMTSCACGRRTSCRSAHGWAAWAHCTAGSRVCAGLCIALCVGGEFGKVGRWAGDTSTKANAAKGSVRSFRTQRTRAPWQLVGPPVHLPDPRTRPPTHPPAAQSACSAPGPACSTPPQRPHVGATREALCRTAASSPKVTAACRHARADADADTQQGG